MTTKQKTKVFAGKAEDRVSFSWEKRGGKLTDLADWINLNKSDMVFDLAIRTGVPIVSYRLDGPPTTIKQIQPGLWYVLANKRVRYLKRKPTSKIVERIEKEHACIR